MEKTSPKSKTDLPAFFRRGGSAAKQMRQPRSAANILKKVMLILIALVCAMLLWGYVLLAQNPDRTKEFTGIEVRLESGSEADLLYKNLMVYGSVASALKDVSVTVSAPLADITKLSAKDITATVNFNDIHSSGISKLVVRAVSNYGTVVDIDPAYIEIDIDEIVTRVLSVDTEFVGELPEGYWHGTPSVSPKTLTIKGARRDIERISNAICNIELEGLTDSVNHSVALKIADDAGNEFDPSNLLESLPAVNVQMQVLPYRTLDVVYSFADELPEGLEVTAASINVSSLSIACEPHFLSLMQNITTEPVYLHKITEPGVYDIPLQLTGLPDAVVILDNTNLDSVNLTLTVEEVKDSRTFEGVNISVAGKVEGYSYAYCFYDENGELGDPVVRLSADVTAYGVLSALGALKASDFVLMLDVSGLGLGSRDVPLRLIWNPAFMDLNAIEYPLVVRVIITPAIP